MVPLPPQPPPLPPLGPNFGVPSNNVPQFNKPGTDVNALLSQIRQGTKLKHVKEVNDRSAPILNNNNERAAKSKDGPMPLGGLFAQGMPKLRPTGANISPKSNSADNIKTELISSQNALSLKASLELRLNLQAKPCGNNENNKYNTISGSRVTRLNDTKGPAPSVPTNKTTPPLPSNPPSVQRSKSQNVREKNRPCPPTSKPPPPPKMFNGFDNQSSGLNRRQSFGGNDILKSNYMSQQIHLRPPTPPRNNSVPNGLNNNLSMPSGTGPRSRAPVGPPPSRPSGPPRLPPPPPPPHQTGVVQEMTNIAPAPPIRNTSINKSDLESRFFFNSKIHTLPAPEPFLNSKKIYSDPENKQIVRRPAPHVPDSSPISTCKK